MSDMYNRAAVRRHALKVSQQTRAGKFTRVSEEFLDNIVAEVENEIRRLRAPATSATGLENTLPADDTFLTGAGREALAAAFDQWVGKVIQRRVHLTRVGKTL